MSPLLLAIFLLGSIGGAGEELPPFLEEGLALYADGLAASDRDQRLELFHRAERMFAKVIEDGHANADLYTNLGNAALQSERIGPATLAYRRALRLDPDHPRARQNLAHVRSLLPAWIPRPEEDTLIDTFFFWHRTLSASERSTVAAICFAVAVLLLSVSVLRRRPLYRNLALIPALAWVALLASLVVEVQGAHGNEAVIVQDEALARAADSANARSPFAEPLAGGTEVEIVERRDPWLRIRLADGRVAWLSSGSVETVD
jgi:hypothetical protein